jgi:hypothetical protein
VGQALNRNRLEMTQLPFLISWTSIMGSSLLLRN